MKKSFSNFILITAIGLTSLSVSSCKKENSEDVNQDKIYAEYELYYDANVGKTYASAVFKFSNALGTNLELTSPSEVKFGTDVIPYDPVFAYYRKEYAGLVPSGTFTFKDKDGTTYTNAVSMTNSIANPIVDTIRRSLGAYTYTWTGDSVFANSWVNMTINNTANALNYQYFLQNTQNSKNIVCGITQLNQLPIGNSFFQVERVYEKTATSVTSAGGKTRAKYKGLNANTYVK